MIPKKPAPHLMRGGYRFSEKIMLQKRGGLAFPRAILYKRGFPPIVTRRTKAVPRGFLGDRPWPSRNEKRRRRDAACAVPPTPSRRRPTSRTRIPANCGGPTTSI